MLCCGTGLNHACKMAVACACADPTRAKAKASQPRVHADWRWQLGIEKKRVRCRREGERFDVNSRLLRCSIAHAGLCELCQGGVSVAIGHGAGADAKQESRVVVEVDTLLALLDLRQRDEAWGVRNSTHVCNGTHHADAQSQRAQRRMRG